MSRYVLTQEQLEHLQQQVQQLSRILQAKQERIRELEDYKNRTVTRQTADLLETIEKLENEIKELKRANKQLAEETYSDKNSLQKINQLEMLLAEERKLREYSEKLAKQVELRCEEEVLVKNLTTELCQLQKAEIQLGAKKIDDLQKQLKTVLHEKGNHSSSQKDMKQIINATSRENFIRLKELKVIVEELRKYLFDLHDEIGRKSVGTKEEEARVKEVGKWLNEISYVMEDVNHIESMRKDLKQLKNEIEYKRKSSVEKQK